MLAGVRLGILLVSPLAIVRQPRCGRTTIVGCELLAARIEAVIVCTQRRIPQSTLVALIFKESLRKIQVRDGVIVRSTVKLAFYSFATKAPLPGRSIIGMRAVSTIGYWPLPFLFHCIVAECFSISVLAEPDRLGFFIQKSNHGVLPVANMIVHILVQNRGSVIVRIEVHVEDIDVPATVVIDDDSRTHSINRFASAIRFHTIEPRRLLSNIVDRG